MTQMILDEELLRYWKILKSSKRVQHARQMMQLKQSEYIIKFDLKEGDTETTLSKGKKRKLTTAPFDWKFFYGNVQPYVIKEVMEFYDLQYPSWWVLNTIFWGYEFAPEPFTVHPLHKNKNGNMVIEVEVAQKLTSNSQRELLKQISEAVEEAQKPFPLLKFSTAVERIESIGNLDEKYALAKEYEALKKLPRIKRKEEDSAFLRKAASAFQKEKYRSYSLTDAVTDIRDFKRTFGKENIR